MIRINTWGNVRKTWRAIDLEMRWVPGLPQIVFLGARDPALRDVGLRVKSALRSVGFQFPRGLKLLVDVSPRMDRIQLEGMDLPVAFGVLSLTDQIKYGIPKQSQLWVWGDLSLDGEVKAPTINRTQADALFSEALRAGEFSRDAVGPMRRDDNPIASSEVAIVLPEGLVESSGFVARPNDVRTTRRVDPTPIASRVKVFSVKSLKDFRSLEGKIVTLPGPNVVTSQPGEEGLSAGDESGEKWEGLCLNRLAARFVLAAVVGRFSALVLGPSALALNSLLHLIYDLRSYTQSVERSFPGDRSKLPLLAPRAPLSEAALLGHSGARSNGAYEFGSLEQVSGGCFIIQNWENWDDAAKSSILRFAELPTDSTSHFVESAIQVLASGSLCGCGQHDLSLNSPCRCPSRLRVVREQSWRSPLLDQFSMLGLPSGLFLTSTDSPQKRLFGPEYDCAYSIAELRSMCSAGLEFRRLRGGQSRRPRAEAMILSQGQRVWAQEQVARALADVDQSAEVHEDHRREARLWTVLSFAELGRRELLGPWANSTRTDLTSEDLTPKV